MPQVSLNLLTSIITPKKLTKNSSIAKEGEIPNNIYIVKSGILRSFYTDEKGKEYTRSLFKFGDGTGALGALVLKKPSRLTYECLTDCNIYEFNYIEFKKLIKPLLKTLKKGEKPSLDKVKFKSKQKEEIVLKDTQQAYIYFGSSYDVETKDKDSYMAKVASFILGGSGFGSRLMEEIRVKRGLAYSAYGYISVNKSHSYFTGYLQTKNETANEAKELVASIVKDFVKKGVTAEELEAAKNFLTGSEPLRSETLAQRLNRAFTLYYRGLPTDYSKKELEKIQNLKVEDLNEYIKSHDEINKLTFAIVRK